MNGIITGIVRLEHGLPPSTSQYSLVIEATDGGGLTSYTNTVVRISITDPSSRQPEFSQSFYLFSVAEDADRMTLVGVVEATTSEGLSQIQCLFHLLQIYSNYII